MSACNCWLECLYGNKWSLLFFLLVLILLPSIVCNSMKGKCDYKRSIQDNVYEPGEVIIGGILSQIYPKIIELEWKKTPDKTYEKYNFVPKNYQHLLSLRFAVQEVNGNPRLLPNLTLGYLIYDNMFNARLTYEAMVDLLFATPKHIPKNQYGMNEDVMSAVGGFTVESANQLATIMGLFKIPQFMYGAYETTLKDRINLSSIYRMSGRETIQPMGILKLLLNFSWTWVGLMVSDDDDGESFVRILTPLLSENNICISYLEYIKILEGENFIGDKTFFDYVPVIMSKLSKPNTNVVIVSGDYNSLWALRYIIDRNGLFFSGDAENDVFGKVWISTARWDFVSPAMIIALQSRTTLDGTLSFSTHRDPVPRFYDFLDHLEPDESLMQFICLFWKTVFDCKFSHCSFYTKRWCKGKEKLKDLPLWKFEMDMTSESYGIYNAVYAIAHALHIISESKQRRNKNRGQLNVQPWELQAVLRKIYFNNGAEHEILLENGEVISGYDILNWFKFPNYSIVHPKVGYISENNDFIIREDLIKWDKKFKQRPESRCVKNCHPGQNKLPESGKSTCCYRCISCPENMISNETDAAQCTQCPTDQYSDKDKDHCIDKMSTFLSYQESLGIILVSFAIFFASMTVWVMITFVKNWNTPIVKANNRNLTCVLLASIFLCYLSSLLFIGEPGKVGCLLRQAIFGIIFSVAVSSVLAKTIIVILAFLATKPGNSMRKWLGQKVANAIVLSCSLVQMCICTAWLLTCPPFPNADMETQTREIILECNEGSLTFFSCVLSYMGFLALLSFTVAFLARKLPDTFNEAKFITFSMLMFCSVWVSFIPGYLSTKGKYIVAVEVFAILASNTGLLACIFLPKCYVILLRPDLNSKKILKEKTSYQT